MEEMEEETDSEEGAAGKKPVLVDRELLVKQPILVGKLNGRYKAGMEIMFKKKEEKDN